MISPIHRPKKKLISLTLIGIYLTTILTGCLNLQVGGGTTHRPQVPTVGQQMIDLQQAKETGAITDAEYQAQKAKILDTKDSSDAP